MLASALLLAGFAALVWIIVGLAKGVTPAGFGFGDALAALVYLAAFLPNVLVTIIALALGAPVEVGARVTFGGREVGPFGEWSLLDWGGDPTPWYLFLLLAIPLLSCMLGGFSARRNAHDPPRWLPVLAGAAVTFAVPLTVVALLADARLGAGLVTGGGFAHVAPDALLTLVFGLLWADALGYIGWRVADAQEAASSKEAKRGP